MIIIILTIIIITAINFTKNSTFHFISKSIKDLKLYKMYCILLNFRLSILFMTIIDAANIITIIIILIMNITMTLVKIVTILIINLNVLNNAIIVIINFIILVNFTTMILTLVIIIIIMITHLTS